MLGVRHSGFHQGLRVPRVGICRRVEPGKPKSKKADLKAGFSVCATATAEVGVVGGTGFEPVTPTMSR